MGPYCKGVPNMNAPIKPSGGTTKISVSATGKAHFPAELRKRLSVEKGGKLIVREDENGIRLMTIKEHLDAIRAMVAPYVKGASVDKYLAEKRAEAHREWGEHR
jgi:bifunctional DNA-binding transcriptional regulator/antitoxin component of YhaV-PrlF toxin-antitoxin module